MGGFSNGTTNFETYDGSQFHQAPNWIDDPLTPASLQQFVNTNIPAGFEPVDVPFLSGITQFTGTGYTALAAVPTTNLIVPFAVDLFVNNYPSRWFLTLSNLTTQAGITRPNDFNAITNPKAWVQET